MKNHRRQIVNLVSMLGLAAVVAVLAAMPAAGEGIAGEPPLATSSNVQFLTHIPGTAAGMNFKDHYAYVSGWGGITVLDIAKADSPALVGALPLPHFENEDVDLCGNTLIVVNDREAKDIGSVMYVVSIANRTSPVVSAILPLGLTGNGRGSGHIANFVKSDCSQAVGRRRRPRRGRRPDGPDCAEVARQVRVGRFPEPMRSRCRTTPSSTAPARCGTSVAGAQPATG